MIIVWDPEQNAIVAMQMGSPQRARLLYPSRYKVFDVLGAEVTDDGLGYKAPALDEEFS